jgi:hypothetical protein
MKVGTSREVCGQFASPHHAPVALFVVAVAVARPLVSSHLPEPQCWRRIRWRSCRRCPKLYSGLLAGTARHWRDPCAAGRAATRHPRSSDAARSSAALSTDVPFGRTPSNCHLLRSTHCQVDGAAISRRFHRRQSQIHARCSRHELLMSRLAAPRDAATSSAGSPHRGEREVPGSEGLPRRKRWPQRDCRGTPTWASHMRVHDCAPWFIS